MLKTGQLPVHEPDLDDLLSTHRDRIGFVSSSKALTECDIVFVARDVATDENNNSDLTYLNQIMDEVLSVVPASIPVVLLSQVHPGYTRLLLKKRLMSTIRLKH